MKIYSKKELLENNQSILNSIDYLLHGLNELTNLKDTATPDFKEGMVVYFTNLSPNTLNQIEKKLSLPKKEQSKLKLPNPTNKSFYGDKSFNLVDTAVKHLSDDTVDNQNEIRLFANALSIARLIQSIYGKPVQADRGDLFTKIREHSVQLVSDVEPSFQKRPDKWCPADIYIYNDGNSANLALTSKTLNIGKDSLNAQFQSDPKKTSKKIFGISLKEEKAQGGAGGSFEKILKREQYPESKKISNYSLLSTVFHYERSKKYENTSTSVSEISTAHASALNMLNPKFRGKFKGAEKVVSDLETTLKLTLGNKLTKNANGKYDKKYVSDLFSEKKLKSIKYAPTLEKSMNTLVKNLRSDSEREYTSMRNSFVNTLKEMKINPPAQHNIKNLPIKIMLAKAGCYKAAAYVLNGLNSGNMNVPKLFKNIASQKNPFVAWTAYAIGMAGISPTFFKMVGKSTLGQLGVMESFYGDSFLNLDEKTEIKISDTDKRMGFSVQFITKVTREEVSSSDVVKRYKVNLSFQSGGDVITISVIELKETE
jgi:hypothetical protein